MKLLLMMSAAVVVSVALLGLVQVRKKEQQREDKRSRFEGIKLQVTYDVLGEYQGEKAEAQNRLEKSQEQQKALEEEVKMLRAQADKAKGELDVCRGAQVCGGEMVLMVIPCESDGGVLYTLHIE